MDTVMTARSTLHASLGTPQAPWIVDVRREPAFAADDRMLPGALRLEAPLPSSLAMLPRRPVVVYCVRGHEVSLEAAAELRSAGFEASALEGGIEGWRADGLPTLRRRPEWRVPGGSRWITRERPKIDRIACPWLIRRFIDPLAAFDYVPAPTVLQEAQARGAIPYDVPGVAVTHRGERCSFDALIEDFALDDPALARLATIVRGADTDRLHLAPQSAGLLAASLGLSRRYGSDDQGMLGEAMSLYDALYAWCRAEVTGVAETHAWTPA